MNNSQRRTYSRKVERINRQFENKWQPAIRKSIQAKANKVIARLRSGGVSEAMNYLTKDLSNTALAEEVRKLYKDVGLTHAKRVNKDLESEPRSLKSAHNYQVKRIGFNTEWIRFVMDYLEQFLFDKITLEVNSTTRDALMRALRKGVDDGLGVDDIIRLLKEWPYARFQAARIVRTEINRAANVGAMAGGSTFKYEQQKEWIAAMDKRTRGSNPKDHANHRELDGNVVNETELFRDVRNGDELEFPGDPKASAASTVNCRCSVALVAKRDENGKLIPKQSRISIVQPGQIRRPNTITI